MVVLIFSVMVRGFKALIKISVHPTQVRPAASFPSPWFGLRLRPHYLVLAREFVLVPLHIARPVTLFPFCARLACGLTHTFMTLYVPLN